MVTGDQRHLGRSFLLVLIGVAVAVGLSCFFGWATPGSLDLSANSQVQGRISPRMVDLVVALGSGAAGAFALSRRSVADALPGVAIAISLVPPLCVVGICLSQGDVASASGAMLLFATNLVAILVAGGGLLALMGYGAVARRGVQAEGRRKAAAVTGIALVAILVPLVVTSTRLAQDSLLEATARSETQAWLDGSGYEMVGIVANGDTLEITIDGDGPIPPTTTLASALERASSSGCVRWPPSTSR
jgi:uncharacterized hydrophobic protein (TIGR00271 family)